MSWSTALPNSMSARPPNQLAERVEAPCAVDVLERRGGFADRFDDGSDGRRSFMSRLHGRESARRVRLGHPQPFSENRVCCDVGAGGEEGVADYSWSPTAV